MRNFNSAFPVFFLKPWEILLHKLLKNEFCEAFLRHDSGTRWNLKGKRFRPKINKFEEINFEQFLMVWNHALWIFWGDVFSLFSKNIWIKNIKNVENNENIENIWKKKNNYVTVWTVIRKLGDTTPNKLEELAMGWLEI